MPDPTLDTPANPNIRIGDLYEVKQEGLMFFYQIENGWQQRHANIYESVRWQYGSRVEPDSIKLLMRAGLNPTKQQSEKSNWQREGE